MVLEEQSCTIHKIKKTGESENDPDIWEVMKFKQEVNNITIFFGTDTFTKLSAKPHVYRKKPGKKDLGL